jgi:hypothetical protein
LILRTLEVIISWLADHLEGIRPINTSAFGGTNPKEEPTTSGLPTCRELGYFQII